MAFTLPNGAIFAIASGYSIPIPMTALSNAAAGIATLAAGHPVVAGDYLEVSSGWSRLTNKIVKAGDIATNDVPLLGQDTTLTSIYPAGGGAGTLRVITGWTQLQQILSATSSGGEQQFITYQPLDSDSEKRLPTTKSASGIELGIADDPSLAGYLLASAANDDRLPRAVRVSLPNGAVLLYNAIISLNKTPSLTVNQIMACQCTLSLMAEPVRY